MTVGGLALDRIHLLDAVVGLKQLADASVDLVVTDPPYNISDAKKLTIRGGKPISTLEAWGAWDRFHPFDYDVLIRHVISQCYRVLKPGGALFMFTAQEDNGFFIHQAVTRGFTYRNQLAMVKKNPLPSLSRKNFRHAFEVCMYVTKGKPQVFNFLSQQDCINTFHYSNSRRLTKHPTEKPLDFIKKLIQICSNEGDLVLDPFMGSGTTAVASQALGRHFVGFELNRDYIKMANDRLKGGTQVEQGRLHDAP